MWPWEHLALAYLITSLTLRVVGVGVPTTGATLAIVLGSQFPDLVDKPLAWGLDVLPSGLTLGHSLLFATPLTLSVLVVADRLDQRTWALAFAVAYGSHLLGDVLFALLTSGTLAVSFLFWPLVPASPDPGVGFLVRVDQLARRFWRFLGTPRGRLYLAFEIGLLVSALLLWVRDGTPGVSALQWLSPGR